jgi:peptide deformylase
VEAQTAKGWKKATITAKLLKAPLLIATVSLMQVIKAPDARLRAQTKPVKKITPGLLQTIKEMVKLTRTFLDPEGVGLAATQIGLVEQFFVAKQKDNSFKTFFNPQIHSSSKATKLFFEGCLSIPDYYGEISRPIAVTVSYLDKNGKEVKERLTGLNAWIFQHEWDHLNGKLFMDHVLEQKAKLYKVVGKDKAGAEVFEEVNLNV